MRFGLDLVFLADDWRIVRVAERVAPRRFAFERRAAAVLELKGGTFRALGVDEGPRSRHRFRSRERTEMLEPDDLKARIVVCEDDDPTRELLCENLLADRYDPLPAATAADALRHCRYSAP